jgi:hypothetical protein
LLAQMPSAIHLVSAVVSMGSTVTGQIRPVRRISRRSESCIRQKRPRAGETTQIGNISENALGDCESLRRSGPAGAAYSEP